MRYLVFLLGGAVAASAQVANFDELYKLATTKSGKAAAELAKVMQADAIKKGTAALSKGGDFIFAVDSASTPQLVIDDGTPQKMTRGGGGTVWFSTAKLAIKRTHNFNYLVDGIKFGMCYLYATIISY